MPRTHRSAESRSAESPVEPLKRQLAERLFEHVEPMERAGAPQGRIAQALGLTPQRWSALRHGRLDLFSLDGLVELAMRAGLVVRVSATRPYSRE